MSLADILHALNIAMGILLTQLYGYQLVYLFLPLFCKPKTGSQSKQLHYAILIAARNEEKVLPYLLQSIRAQNYPEHLLSIFVVADNCTDKTALAASSNGATVFCRNNPARAGKGYALHFLLHQIQQVTGLDRYDCFLIFDADNLLEPDFIHHINKIATAGYDVFCGLRNSKNFSGSGISAGHGLWFLHDSVHLNASRMVLGLPCVVTGTGFGFRRQVLETAGGWNFFTLTEDIEFSTWCILQGLRCGFSPDAKFYDEQPTTISQSWRQRTRWVQGGIQVSLRYGPALLRGMLRGGRQGFACMEALSLSLWGYSLGALGGILGLLSSYAASGLQGVAVCLLLALSYAWLSSWFMGLMTLLYSWEQIRAGFWYKLFSLFAFPFFMLTYIPIAISALFRKFHWPPIEHTAACSLEECRQK